MTNIVEFKNVTLNYGGKRIFDKISFNIAEGSFVTVIGSNGSGKSCLAYIIYGILPCLGSVKFSDKVISEKNIDNIRENISIVFEESNSLFVTDTVLDELIGSAKDKKDVDYITKKLDISHLLYRNLSSLSCGEQQLISLACALVSKPKLLVLDGALNMLDASNKKKIMKFLNQYNKRGLTIVHITENSEDILYGNQVMVLDDRKIILNESLKKALEHEKIFARLHLNLPFMADLCTKLKYYNIISKIELNKVRLVNSIWK